MKRSHFHYQLPRELIAQHPLPERAASRLLHLNGSSGGLEHRQFPELLSLLGGDDLLVFNDTRVIPARLWGQKETGGKLEILVERITGRQRAMAHIRCSKSPRPGTLILLSEAQGEPPGPWRLRVEGRDGELFAIATEDGVDLAEVLQAVGHMPLPPYIERADELADRERYQTVFGCREGAVAAPTAGLHFTRDLLAEIEAKGVRSASVTLHVGAGTFQPVRADDIEDHRMHAEYVEVSDAVCRQVRETRERGGRVVAIGTTAVRSLESACRGGDIQPFTGDTSIFIYPGYRFRCVDAMVTNFHLPESTLLMLVSAFAGREHIMAAYAEAIRCGYRFVSYGDAMFITAADGAREQR